MSDIAIVYMSKYGHTKQYADWLKEDLKADVIALGSFNPARMLSYKLVIFASGVYGDKIQIMDFIKKNYSSLNPQRMMIAAVTWYTNNSEEAKNKLISDNYTDVMKNVIPLYVLNSGIDKKAISAMEKVQLKASQLMIEKRDGRSSDDINALAIIKGYSDQMSRDNIEPLKQGIDLFFNPPKVSKIKPAPRPVQKPLPEPTPVAEQPKPEEKKLEPIPAPIPETKPEPAPEKKLEPVQTSTPGILQGTPTTEELEDISALNSLESAFSKLTANKHTEQPVQPVQKEETSSGGVVLTSLDDALAALSGGGIPALNKPKPAPAPAPAPTPEAPKPAVIEEIKPEPVKAEEIKLEPVLEPVKAEEIKPEPVLEPVKAEEIKPEPVLEPVKAEEIKPELVLEPVKAEEIKPEPVLEPVKAEEIKSEPVLEPVKAEEIKPEPVLESIKAEESKPAEAPAPEVRSPILSMSDVKPAPKPVAKNSYLEYFSKRSKPASAETKPDPVPETKPEPETEPVSAAIPAPSPVPTTEVSSIDDFDFDLMGNESSTANKVSKRALDAVNALAKAKAAAESGHTTVAAVIEQSKQQKSETYDVIANSLNSPVESEPAPAEEAQTDARLEREEKLNRAAEETVATMSKESASEAFDEISQLVAEANKYASEEEGTPELESISAPVSYDDSNGDGIPDDSYGDDFINMTSDLSDIADELEMDDSSNEGEFTLEKLQAEIEASIEYNKKKKERDRLRNTRELDRNKHEEEKPRKILEQPEDPDIFFRRPGKDYYDTDTMPEIRFDRRRRGK